MQTWMLRGALDSALFAFLFFTLLLASSFLITVALSSTALPNFTLLPLDCFSTGVSTKLWLHGHNASPDSVTFATGLVAL